MNGRERVQATVRRSGPLDRVPLGDMGFDAGVTAKLCAHLGVADIAAARRKLGIDIVGVWPRYVGHTFDYKPPDARRSFFGSSHKSYADGLVSRPLRDARHVRDVEAFAWPAADDYDFGALSADAGAWEDCALYCPGWTPTFSQLCELFGMETALLNLLDRPALIEAAVERITDLVCGLATRARAALGERLLIFKTADDVASQRGLIFSPELWRRYFRTPLARQFETGRRLGMINMIHSCGAVGAILPDLVEIGLDVLEPTQVHLPGMAADDLKRRFGRHLTFFGAVCTQRTLPHGSPRDVRAEVRRNIDVLGAGGGYICSPDHTVLDDVPLANVLALYEAVHER